MSAPTITQKEIALELGVSRTLVTMALQDNPRINAHTRERVKEAAARLGYTEHSNREARALINRRYGKRPRTGIIAVFSPQTTFQGMAIPTLPYFEDFLRGVEGTALQSDTDVFLCTLHESRLPRLVAEGNVDGVVTIGRMPGETKDLPVPVVSFASSTPWSYSLMLDHNDGMDQAVEHLVSHGHAKIAFMGCGTMGKQWPNEFGSERLEAFRLALQKRKMTQPSNLLDMECLRPAVDHGAAAMDRVLGRTRDFTAVICFNDLMAMGAMERLAQDGIRVPEDVSVIGFDAVSRRHNSPLLISSVAFDREAMGRRAAEVIIGAATDLEAGRSADLAGRIERFQTWFEPGESSRAPALG